MSKILRITTVPISLNILLKGQLKFMKSQGFPVVTASAGGEEVEQLIDREEVSHFIIDFTRKMSPLRDLIALLQTINVIRKVRPDIVHTHTPKAGLIGMIAAWLCGVKIRMHTVAGMPMMEATGLTRLILLTTERITYNCATNVYPNSFQLKSWIENNVMTNAAKLTVLADGSTNGIDTTFFGYSEETQNEATIIKDNLQIPDDAIIFIFVGRLVRDKGINELIRAFLQVSKQTKSSVYLILVGAYEDQREPVQENVKELIEKTSNIYHVGFQSDIRPYLALSDIFVFPSYREGFPNVVMQAACFDLPCIVSDINGCNEIITHEANGLLVPLKDMHSLTKAMLRLLKNQGLRETMRQVARKSVVEKYDQKLVWEAILKEYKRLLILHGVQTDN